MGLCNTCVSGLAAVGGFRGKLVPYAPECTATNFFEMACLAFFEGVNTLKEVTKGATACAISGAPAVLGRALGASAAATAGASAGADATCLGSSTLGRAGSPRKGRPGRLGNAALVGAATGAASASAGPGAKPRSAAVVGLLRVSWLTCCAESAQLALSDIMVVC